MLRMEVEVPDDVAAEALRQAGAAA
jgi:hypothetical protein